MITPDMRSIRVVVMWPLTTMRDFPDADMDPFRVMPPKGSSYLWASSGTQAHPDINPITSRLGNGWVFVDPKAHPKIASAALSDALDSCCSILMTKSAVEVQKTAVEAKAANDAKLEAVRQEIENVARELGGHAEFTKGTT